PGRTPFGGTTWRPGGGVGWGPWQIDQRACGKTQAVWLTRCGWLLVRLILLPVLLRGLAALHFGGFHPVPEDGLIDSLFCFGFRPGAGDRFKPAVQGLCDTRIDQHIGVSCVTETSEEGLLEDLQQAAFEGVVVVTTKPTNHLRRWNFAGKKLPEKWVFVDVVAHLPRAENTPGVA